MVVANQALHENTKVRGPGVEATRVHIVHVLLVLGFLDDVLSVGARVPR